MNAATLSVIDDLCTAIAGAAGIPSGITAMAALIAKCRREKRDASPDEIQALKADDDAISKQLDLEIAAARMNS